MALGQDGFTLFLNDVRNVITGNLAASQVSTEAAAAATQYVRLQAYSRMALTALAFAVAVLGLFVTRSRITPELRARNSVERVFEGLLFLCSLVAVLTTLGIVLSVVFEATRFFNIVPASDFLFGTRWSPQMAIRADQVGSSGAFGAIPLFAGTLLISFIAMIVAVPIGL
ncbi:MAG: phosphate ABC transporter permease subunit PstC, partial [Proteobacteria bacterium]|nr:phosphate ABC transporter permease subunit PstC [Pseudomonadota bacterium]